MNIDFFMDQCQAVFPSKELTAGQWGAYREKLTRFSDRERQVIYDAILENCKFFPKISDIYEQAGKAGFLNERTEYKPHVWKDTDCRFCAGSGLMAAFYLQEFSIEADGKTQTLKLVHVCPYHKSAGRYHEQKDEVRTVFRCECPSGGVETVGLGIPRWSKDQPIIRERPWG